MNRPGGYATANLVPFVKTFFAVQAGAGSNLLPTALLCRIASAPGQLTLSVSELIALGVTRDKFELSFVQRGWDVDTADDAARRYSLSSFV